MQKGDIVLGVLQVSNKRDQTPFNQQDQALLTAFAGQVVTALENARLLQQTDAELQDRVTELSMLHQLDRELNATLALNNVLDVTLSWTMRLFRATAGCVLLVDNTQAISFWVQRGYDRLPNLADLDLAKLYGESSRATG